MLLLCVVDVFSKYAWVVTFKDKKSKTITKTFQEIAKQNQTKYG